jgi:periplasmic protein TonB
MLALRLPFAANSGALVALAVFTLLWRLVGVPIDLEPPRVATKIDFTRLLADTPVEVKRQAKAVRPPPARLPEPARAAGRTGIDPPTAFVKTSFEPVLVGGHGAPPMRPDGDVIPVVRPAPEYPPRELAKGTEGWVQVRFAVTTIGTVRDAVVVAAEPPKVFDDAALKAIARWRYNPRVEQGVAVERIGLQTIIRFQIDR